MTDDGTERPARRSGLDRACGGCTCRVSAERLSAPAKVILRWGTGDDDRQYVVGIPRRILSILSPCVLPILPIVLGSAASSHRQGPLALAAGLSLSFVGIGLFVATVGHSIGLDADRLRYVAATLMMSSVSCLSFRGCRCRSRLRRARSETGPTAGWRRAAPTALPDSFGSAHFSEPYGAHASGRHLEPRLCLPPKAGILVK